MFKLRKLPVIALASASLLGMASAQAEIRVDEPWVRATVPHQPSTGAFMRLTSTTDTALVAADSPAAEQVEIHEMTMDGDIMRMREIPSVQLPAGETVDLKPGGYHIMLIDLLEQAQADNTVPLTLTFEHADGTREQIDIEAPVRALGNASGAHGHAPAKSH